MSNKAVVMQIAALGCNVSQFARNRTTEPKTRF